VDVVDAVGAEPDLRPGEEAAAVAPFSSPSGSVLPVVLADWVDEAMLEAEPGQVSAVSAPVDHKTDAHKVRR